MSLFKPSTPIQVRGAILYNDYIIKNNLIKKYDLIREGEKIKYVYLKLPNHFKNNVISYPVRLPKELGLEDHIDYDTQFEKTFLDPINDILKCIGWEAEKSSSLESFF